MKSKRQYRQSSLPNTTKKIIINGTANQLLTNKIVPEEQSVDSWLPFFAEVKEGCIKEIQLKFNLTIQLKITSK